jgi:hypothetical protein
MLRFRLCTDSEARRAVLLLEHQNGGAAEGIPENCSIPASEYAQGQTVLLPRSLVSRFEPTPRHSSLFRPLVEKRNDGSEVFVLKDVYVRAQGMLRLEALNPRYNFISGPIHDSVFRNMR